MSVARLYIKPSSYSFLFVPPVFLSCCRQSRRNPSESDQSTLRTVSVEINTISVGINPRTNAPTKTERTALQQGGVETAEKAVSFVDLLMT